MRKEVFVTLIDDGAERLFKIKQMSAVKQERWINRTVTLLLGGGAFNKVNISKLQDKFAKGNYNDLLSIFAALKYDDVEPLYNELLECCEHIPDKTNRNFSIPQTAETIDSVITEVKNLYKLRLEALKVNFGFFSEGENSPKRKTAAIQISKNT